MQTKYKELQKRLDEHKKEQEILKQEIMGMGAIIKNGKIIPPKEDEIYLIDSFFYAQTQYESEGEYYIQKQARIATKEQVEQFTKIAETAEGEQQKEAFLDFWEDNSHKDTLLYGTEAVNYGDDYLVEEDIRYIATGEDEIYERDLLLEIILEDTRDRWHGYISVFKGTEEDYKKLKASECKKTICKYLRANA